MKKIFFTPGPTQLYPTIPKHITEALKNNILSISHRGDTFHEIIEMAKDNLRKLLNIPPSQAIFFLSSATEAMERIIENVVLKDSIHLVNGSFSQLFYDIASKLGKNAQKIEKELGKGFDLTTIDVSTKPELICITQNETSTGVAIPMEYIHAMKKGLRRDSLIALDIVSSAPYPQINFSLIDLVFFSVQKGFGLPAGLGVLIASPSAIEKAAYVDKKKKTLGSYHTFGNLLTYDNKQETPETPNVLALYLLGKVSQDFLKKGIESIRKETKEKMISIDSRITKDNKLSYFVKDPKFRSDTVIVVNIEGGSTPVLERLKTKGYIVGSGYRKLKEQQIRIANFPAHRIGDVKKMLSII